MPVLISDIILATERAFPKCRGKLRARDRAYPVSHPRQFAMAAARAMTDRSTTEIGHAFGGRDHSTAIHAIQVTAKRRAENDWANVAFLALLDEGRHVSEERTACRELGAGLRGLELVYIGAIYAADIQVLKTSWAPYRLHLCKD